MAYNSPVQLAVSAFTCVCPDVPCFPVAIVPGSGADFSIAVIIGSVCGTVLVLVGIVIIVALIIHRYTRFTG